jgi:hypothetical protein
LYTLHHYEMIIIVVLFPRIGRRGLHSKTLVV